MKIFFAYSLSILSLISLGKPAPPHSDASAVETEYGAPDTPRRSTNWPGWRGVLRCGTSIEEDVPTRWTSKAGIRWKTPLVGNGISSPIIWEDSVFVSSSDGKQQSDLHLICLDRRTGGTRWHLELWGTAPTRHHASKSSMASPTPITDGKHVYAFFGTGDVFCVDFDGGLVWHRSLAAEYGAFENRFSATSSPLLVADILLLQCDHYGDSYAVGLDKRTGANLWKVDRPNKWLSWSSPQLVSNGGNPEVVLCSSTTIEAIDPASGKLLWTMGGMQRECIPTPVLGHGLIYAVSGPNGTTYAIKPGGRGEISKTHVVWKNNRGAPFVPSSILVGDYYYLVADNGIATCLNAHSGKREWQKRLPGDYTASPIATGSHIYFTNEAGLTTVIKANVAEYVEIARNPLDESVFASGAISQGDLYVRGTTHLYSIRGKP